MRAREKIVLLAFLMLFLPVISLAQEKKSFQYFYAGWCSHCQKVDEFFKSNGVYGKFDVEKINFNSLSGKNRLTELFKEHNYGGQAGIPAVAIDEKLIVGDEPIISYFKNNFELSEETKKEKKSAGTPFPLLVLVGAALADAINPCAFAVLILLLAAVVKAKGRNQAFFSGAMFTLAIFISYFLMGLGVYKAITIFNLPKYISLTVGFIAVLIGLANLKDVFWHGKFFVMEVPMSWRPKMKAVINRITTPKGALVGGFLVSLFLLPCTSGPYIVILGLLAEKAEMAKTLSLLALYNFIFVFPMILITLGMYFGARMKKLEEIRSKNNRLLHAAVGVIMLAMGIYLIQGWI